MEEEIVVKCKGCDKYFGQTKEDPTCKFCHAPYNEPEEEAVESKVPIKTKKESFRVWKNS